MKLSITLDDAKDLDGAIKEALEGAIKGMVRDQLQATVEAAIKKHSELILERLEAGMERRLDRSVSDSIEAMLVAGGFGVRGRAGREAVFKESFQATIEKHFSIKRLDEEVSSLAQGYAPGIVRAELAKLVENDCKEIVEGYKRKLSDNLKSALGGLLQA